MMYKTPVTMNEALELLAFFDKAYWTLHTACVSSVLADGRRQAAEKREGRVAAPLSSTHKCRQALGQVEHMTVETVRRLNAERMGAAYQPYDGAARLFCDARLAMLPEDQDALIIKLTDHLSRMHESDWLGSDVIAYKYGTDVTVGLAKLLEQQGRYTPVVRCMLGWPDLERVPVLDAGI